MAQFRRGGLAAGFGSVHALPLRLRGTVIGALNLFHVEAGQMPRADVEAALADVATIAILLGRPSRIGGRRQEISTYGQEALGLPARRRAPPWWLRDLGRPWSCRPPPGSKAIDIR